MKKKLDVDFRPYTILGACNPEFAHKALQTEDMIGTMLPCNVVIVQEAGEEGRSRCRRSIASCKRSAIQRSRQRRRSQKLLKQVIASLRTDLDFRCWPKAEVLSTRPTARSTRPAFPNPRHRMPSVTNSEKKAGWPLAETRRCSRLNNRQRDPPRPEDDGQPICS
jgi:hypothetical protein